MLAEADGLPLPEFDDEEIDGMAIDNPDALMAADRAKHQEALNMVKAYKISLAALAEIGNLRELTEQENADKAMKRTFIEATVLEGQRVAEPNARKRMVHNDRKVAKRDAAIKKRNHTEASQDLVKHQTAMDAAKLEVDRLTEDLPRLLQEMEASAKVVIDKNEELKGITRGGNKKEKEERIEDHPTERGKFQECLNHIWTKSLGFPEAALFRRVGGGREIFQNMLEAMNDSHEDYLLKQERPDEILGPLETDTSFVTKLSKQFSEVDESTFFEALDDTTKKLVTNNSGTKELLIKGVRQAQNDCHLRKLTKLKSTDPASKTAGFNTKRVGTTL